MTDEDYKELAEMFFRDIVRSYDVDSKIPLKKVAESFIKNDQNIVELKVVGDAKMYAGSLLREPNLKVYFELVDNTKDTYRLSEKGREEFKRVENC